MHTSEKNCYSLPAHTILDLIKELTVGQRSTDTLEQLAHFLHSTLFPKLGPFFIEIYFPDRFLKYYLPRESNGHSGKTNKNVPPRIAADAPLLAKMRTSPSPLEFSSSTPHPEFLKATGNAAHLLAPIRDEADLLGLLYIGCIEHCLFSPLCVSAIETLAAIIGSRLKSMGTIRQLKESMHALEYSERLRTALHEISEQAHHAKNIADLYAYLHQIVGGLIPAKNFYIALVEEQRDGQYITFPYFVDSNDPHFQGMEIKLDQENLPITGYLLKTRQPLLLTPDNFEPLCQEHNIRYIGTRPHSWLGAPFYLDDISGAVAIQSYNDIIYTEKDKELMAFVARHLGDALKRKRTVDALKQAKDRAELAERNKSTFLANMSHEIRTPMNGIIGLTELVLKSDISGHQRTYLEMVHSSADRLLKLINDILDFSKIEAGKLELNVTPFSLRSTIADALEILAISAAKKNIALTVDCHESIPDLLLGDADKLHQIFINLLGNAVKFTNQGSVTLTIHPGDSSMKKGDSISLRFQVKDTGIGIPAEHINNVFKAFNQLGTTRNSNHRGTGLGLVIAAELVEMMGGKICVESNPGVGTTFYFSARFPLAPAAQAEQPAFRKTSTQAHNPKQAGRKSLHILLVEDEYINRTLAVSVLEREGWMVAVAENGVEALKFLDNESVDLILMDIQMPELNGYETTHAIRQKEQGTDQHVPIIAMTAYAVIGDREKCLAAGMDGYVSKPIRPDQLREEIEIVMQHHAKPFDA
jgi:signal transduction histidine kinase/ActR/RegA family two-component response regulator